MYQGAMRGRGDGRYRRQPSPGRWEGSSPPVGRPRPGSRGGSPPRSVSRSLSRSPVRPRQGGRGPPPQRGGPSPKRLKRSYSSSGSDDSGSASSSSSDDSRGDAPSKPAVPLPGAIKKEMTHLKSREKELLGKMNDLQEELDQEKAAKDTLQAKSEFLSNKIKAVAERSKNRGSMLVQLITALTGVNDCKVKLKEAEADLERLLQEATDMMQNEESYAERSKETANGGQASVKQEHAQARDPVGNAQGGYAPEQGAQDATGQENHQGGWTETQYASDAAAAAAAAGKPFKPFKFNIKL